MRNSNGQFVKGHTANVGKRWKVKDSSKMGGKRHNNGFQNGNKLGLGKKYRQGVKPSPETILKMSKSARRGPNCKFWRGGVTSLRKQIRRCFQYNQWRLNVFIRDKFSCIKCGKKDRTIEADHFPISFAEILHSQNIRTFQQALDCPAFWDVNNGRTLCRECHMKTDNHGKHHGNS